MARNTGLEKIGREEFRILDQYFPFKGGGNEGFVIVDQYLPCKGNYPHQPNIRNAPQIRVPAWPQNHQPNSDAVAQSQAPAWPQNRQPKWSSAWPQNPPQVLDCRQVGEIYGGILFIEKYPKYAPGKESRKSLPMASGGSGFFSQMVVMVSADIKYRRFVGGLAWATNNRSLERAFGSFGEVIESKIISHRETGRSRGFGFITFSNEQSMRDVIEGMNGQNLDGRSITVNEAQLRGRGGGGGGGDGRGFRNSGRHSCDGYEGGGGGGYSRSGGGGGGRDRGYGGSDGASRYCGGGEGALNGNWRN